jgi:hypothetical protein
MVKKDTKTTLEPRKSITVDGKIYYSDGARAWNVINLKKEMFSEFPQLKERMSKFSYEMMLHRDFDALQDFIKTQKGKSVMPVLMWIYKE